jgi:16S rRNA processing protein RimM
MSAAVTGAAAPALPADAVEVGRIIGAWGVQGGIKVKPHASDPQALFSSKRWHLQPPEVPRPPGVKPLAPWPLLLRVVSAREQGECVVATVQDVADRDAAEALKGGRIFVPRTSFPTPDADEFYWVDLIGLAVRNREQVALGNVVGLIETGPHCVIRVQGSEEGAEERLIPFVDAYVDGVDLAGRLITVDWDPAF